MQMLPSETGAGVDFLQAVSLRLSDLLLDDVCKRRLSDLSRLWRSVLVERGCEAILDFRRPLGMGLYRGNDGRLDCAVQLWSL